MAAGPAAHAALGGDTASIEADRAYFAARSSTTAMGGRTVHLLTLTNGTVVREFARADGMVFAVTWRGPARPDLRQLLGPGFDVLQADNVLAGGRRTHRPLSVRRADLAVSSGGHSGAFWGLAYRPTLAPPGFSLRNLS